MAIKFHVKFYNNGWILRHTVGPSRLLWGGRRLTWIWKICISKL